MPGRKPSYSKALTLVPLPQSTHSGIDAQRRDRTLSLIVGSVRWRL